MLYITRNLRRCLLSAILMLTSGSAAAQQRTEADSIAVPTDSIAVPTDSIAAVADSLSTLLDRQTTKRLKGRDWALWRPDPKRALWLALVIPGGGQIYNRKYWKLPLVYGGFMGCIYAMNWNNSMYKDYSQAYLDLMDSDPSTQSYNQFLHFGTQITAANEERYKDIFKKRKDRYRRYRDMSFFVMVGVYALSVIDAYVDAELSVFDISNDLSLRVEPAVVGSLAQSPGVGLQCSLEF